MNVLARRSAAPLACVAGLLAAAGASADPTPRVRLLADTATGTNSGSSTSASFVRSDNAVFFRSGTGMSELWWSSGVPGGTARVDTQVPADATPFIAPGMRGVVYYHNVVGATGLYFADNATGTKQPLDSNAKPYPSGNSFQVVNGRVLCAPIAGYPVTQLWSWDPVAGSRLLAAPTETSISAVTVAGAQAFFFSGTAPSTLWRTDGTPEGTIQVAEFTTRPSWSQSSSPLHAVGSVVYFPVQYSTTHSRIWVSDGTNAHAVVEPLTGLPSTFGISRWGDPDGDGLYASRRLASGVVELWRFGKDTSESRFLLNFPANTSLRGMGFANNLTLFGDVQGSYTTSLENTLWVTDGTQDLMFGLPGILPGSGGVTTLPPIGGNTTGAASFAVAGDNVWFAGLRAGHGAEPWRMNLASGQIGMAADTVLGNTGSVPQRFFTLDGQRGVGFTTQSNGTAGNGLWVSDGDGQSVRFVPTPSSMMSVAPVSVGSRIFVPVTVTGRGTEPGVIELCPGDYDNTGVTTMDDLYGYLNDWLSGSPKANFDDAGVATYNDLLAFLSAWMEGC